MRLRIGHLSTFYHTSIVLMAKGDVERELGADVEWRLFGTGPAIVAAFEKGELDLAYIGLPPAIIGITKGVNIICVAGGHVEGTVIAGDKELIGFPEERDLSIILGRLKDRKIGVPGKGSIHDVIITECLDRFGLTGEVGIINFPWADQVLEAAVNGDISAAVGTPALAVAIERFAGGRILYPPSKLWPNNPSYGILADSDFLTREKETVEKFLVLHEDATFFMRREPRKVARIISDFVGFIDAEFVMDTIKVSPKYCAQITDDYISSTMEFVKILKRLGYIDCEVSRDEIFDTSLIKKVHPEKDHYGDGISDP